MNERLCIIIPAYNAAQSLSSLISELKKQVGDIPIIVVDDGSEDGSCAICLNEKVIYHRFEVNRGKDQALQQGIKMALDRGFTHAILMDADLQHPPTSVPDFFIAFRREAVSLILGRRSFRLGVMPFHRILSNTITSFLISLRTGRRVHDSQCGFRLIALEQVVRLPIRSKGFQYESEVLIRLLIKRVEYREIAVPTIYNNAPSSIHNVWDTLRFIRLFFGSYFW